MAAPWNFQAYAAAGFLEDLLPILPPDAEINPESPSKEQLLSSRGKVPGKRKRNGWVGFGQWSKHETTEAEISGWQTWADKAGSGIGIQGRRFPGLDIDASDPDLADALEQLAIDRLGPAPCRFGREPRRLLPYASAGLKGRALAFKRPVDVDDPKVKADLVELKAAGQQYVLHGVHPRTGKPYSWRDGVTMADAPWGAAGLTEVEPAAWDDYFAAAAELITAHGYVVLSNSGGGQASAGAAIIKPDAPSLEAVKAALAAIPNDYEKREDWIRIGYAIRGALGDEGEELWQDWSQSWEGGHEAGAIDAAWDGFTAPQSGWRALAEEAAKRSGGEFNSAAYEFGGAGATDEVPTEPNKSLTEFEAAVETLCRRYIYREPLRDWVRVSDARAIKPEAFNDTRDGQWIAQLSLKERTAAWKAEERPDPKEKPRWVSAHDLLKGRAQAIQDLTYMAGKGRLLETVAGYDFNIYLPPERPFKDVVITDAAVAPFHDLVNRVFPDSADRLFILDYMSFIAQNPGRKVQFAPVVFSRMQGVGKDTLLRVLRYGVVGDSNFGAIDSSRLDDPFNADWAPKQVVLVTETPSHRKRDLYDKVKDHVASGAGSLSVNQKNQPRFTVPNNQCWIFTTNKPDALALERHDRRFVILHAREERMPAALRDRVREFFDWDPDTQTGSQRGLLIVGEWLRQRKISEGFSPYECTLVSEAKEEMRKNARGPLEEYLEDLHDERAGPFRGDLALLQDFVLAVPSEVLPRGRSPERAIRDVLTHSLGCRSLGRAYLGRMPEGCSEPYKFDPRQMSMFSVRNHERYAGKSAAELGAEFWAQQLQHKTDDLLSDFFDPPRPADEQTPANQQAVASGAR